MDRRHVWQSGVAIGASMAAGALLGGCASAPAPMTKATKRARPIVIAHRGASGHRPEHTLQAYRLAIAQGADYVEPDVVISKDGVLICRHENEISETTDVAARAEFADRKRTKIIDGESVTGWFTEDFTIAELKTLRARERLPQLRPQNIAFDGQDAIPTLAEVFELAKQESMRVGRTIGVYPETKHPSYFRALGLPLEPPLQALLRQYDWDRLDAPIFIQSFEVGNLKALRIQTRAPLVQLLATDGAPFDHQNGGPNYKAMATPQGLAAIAAYATGVGPQKTLIMPRDQDDRSLAPTTFIADAHAVGLKVHPWTFRNENVFLPAELRRGDPAARSHPAVHGDALAELEMFVRLGVDGVFADFPDIAIIARENVLKGAP